MSLPEITVVAAIIYNSQNQILITKRPAHLHLAGMWEFPGGKVKNGESFECALEREISEETALEINVGSLYWKESVDYSKKKVHLYFYNCTLKDQRQKVVMHEIADYSWVSVDQLRDFEFPKADLNLINHLIGLKSPRAAD